jgi:aryl-alcohol dehydrogenase-like predicted oxidoreductase
MSKIDHKITRRGFLKRAGALSTGSALGAVGSAAQASQKVASDKKRTIPKRPFGKTGANVSILSLGGVLGMSDQLIFRQAFNMGVTYWDTADSYGWGKNEKAIGKYFSKYPQHRDKVFLVTKSATSDPKALSEKLDQSLEKMNTDYVDMYFLHYVKDVAEELTPDVQAWAEKAKSKGKIRLFGFSTHKNMENSMLAGAKLGWVDGIMMSYNYRLMGKDKMKKAVDACVNAGIGLTAMKTQAAFTANFYASIGSETDKALKMTENFMERGFTAEQAKLKAVWENPNIASICSAMSNMTILQANVTAALDGTRLSLQDKQRLNRYAERTAGGYCAGCATNCEPALELAVPICDILRYGMYDCSYQDRDRAGAKALFEQLPASAKVNALRVDYAKAERNCPHGIQIGRIIRQICHDLV